MEAADFQVPACGELCLAACLLHSAQYICIYEMVSGRKTAEVCNTHCLGCQQRAGWTEGPSLAMQNCGKPTLFQYILSCAGHWSPGCSLKSQWKLIPASQSPTAAETAEPWCQHRLPKGLIAGSAGSDSAEAALCESLLWLRSFKSRLSFPFLWEQEWVSGGRLLEAFQ